MVARNLSQILEESIFQKPVSKSPGKIWWTAAYAGVIHYNFPEPGRYDHSTVPLRRNRRDVPKIARAAAGTGR